LNFPSNQNSSSIISPTPPASYPESKAVNPQVNSKTEKGKGVTVSINVTLKENLPASRLYTMSVYLQFRIARERAGASIEGWQICMSGLTLQTPSVNADMLWLRGWPAINFCVNISDQRKPGFN